MPLSGSWRNSWIPASGLRRPGPSVGGLQRRCSRRPLANVLSRMANYELAKAAEADLKGIALYTISKWGPKQAICYGAVLEAHFETIGKGEARTPVFLQHRPEL